MTLAIAVDGISKRYPGVVALDAVSLDVHAGEVHALCGENGAGKSTLMKIMAGAEKPDEGEVRVDGRPTGPLDPISARRLGVGIIYQELSLFPTMSVLDNLFTSRQPVTRWGLLDRPRMRTEATALLARLNTEVPLDAPVGSLSIASQQMLEIARALAEECRVLIMDEPTGTLSERETRVLFTLIRTLRAQGVAIIYISHRLDEVFELADRISVMRDGRLVSTAPTSEMTRERLITLMVGRDIDEQAVRAPSAPGEVLFEARGLTAPHLSPVDLTVRRGEIVGLYGLVGAGRTSLLRLVFGADAPSGGEMTLEARPFRPRTPLDAIERGVGFVTEDRKGQGLVLGLGVRENVTLAALGRFTHAGLVNGPAETEAAQRVVDDLHVKTPSLEQRVANLSGGNQQKVVVARWLLTDSRLLLFDEPTRGVDVGAKQEIYQLMNHLAGEGRGILMSSSDLPEILAMSDRILVMHEGRLAGEVARGDATQERILRLATGGSA